MIDKINAGIDLITKNFGELYAGRTYLLAGEKDTAKTTFILQYLYQGLKEGNTCLLVANQPPRDLVIHAEVMGMDLTPYFLDGTLLVYETVRKEKYPLVPLFQELEKIIVGNPASRFAFEGLDQLLARPGQPEVLIEGVTAFLKNLEKAKATTVITLSLPIAQEMLLLKKTLEDLSTGSFLLNSTEGDRVRSFTVKKLIGSRSAFGTVQFTVEPGRGIVQVARDVLKYPRAEEAPARREAPAPGGAPTEHHKAAARRAISFPRPAAAGPKAVPVPARAGAEEGPLRRFWFPRPKDN